jgi:unsaturated rhamnogalacturonyl hydrolase
MKKFILVSLIFISVIAFYFCNTKKENENVFWTENNSPQVIGRKVISDLISRQDIMMYRTAELTTIHYAEACAGMGAVRLACLSNDTLLLNELDKRYRELIAGFDTLPANHVDANVLGILPFEFYQCGGGNENLLQGLRFADIQWENPTEEGLTNQTRFWIDDIYMIGSLQVAAYRVTGNKIYLERAAKEIDAYLQKLQQPNGLFFHGENAPFHWGRGNGWVAAGLAELIKELPKENEHYTSVLEGYQKMMFALLQYQAPNGMWRQLIDKEESWEESSSTAMFGFAIKAGIDNGILAGENYTKAYQDAWMALTERIDENGKLVDICVGTGKSNDIQYYLDRPKITGDLHGQAPVLWFASSLLSE